MYNLGEKEAAENYPYNCVGAIYYKNKGKRGFIGTGFLIANDLVLTAAHNLYTHPTKDTEELEQKAENLEFYPGISGDLPEKGINVADYRYPKQFKENKSPDCTYDYALLRLSRGVDGPTIELGLDYQSIDNEQLGLLGY